MAATESRTQTYDAQLSAKTTRLQQMFGVFEPPAFEVFASPPENHRMRAEFRVWHDGDDLYYIMFNRETKKRYRVDAFPAVAPAPRPGGFWRRLAHDSC